MTYTPQVDTYYADGSVTTWSQSGSAWSNLANIVDGSTATVATKSGTETSTLDGTGTNAPASNTYSTIVQVRVRAWGSKTGTGLTLQVRNINGGGQILLQDATFGSSGGWTTSNGWSNWYVLDTPDAGWSWGSVVSLYFALINNAGATEETLGKIEVEVTSAPTINNIWGAETGGAEEISAANGTPVIGSSVVRSGAYSYTLTTTGTSDYIAFNPWAAIADAGDNYIVGFAFYSSDVTPSGGTARIMEIRDSGSTTSILRLGIESDGDLILEDSNGTTVLTITAPLSVDTWHYIEVYFEHSDTGYAEVFVDNVSKGSVASEDFDRAGTMTATDTLKFFLDSTKDANAYVDDIYFMSGATSTSERLGNCEVYGYRSSKASVTPDDGGDNLNVGSGSMYWSYQQEVPWSDSNWSGYDGALAGAVNTDDVGGSAGTGGPNTDANITGTIAATKGIWRMQRGNGGGTAHYGLLGNDTDGTIRTADFDPGTSFANYFLVSQSASVVPTASEYCQIGIECTGAQDFECAEMLATILHVPAATGFPYHDGRIGRRRDMRTLINL